MVRVGLLLYCLFLFFYGLNAGDLYRTEGLRAILAAEALRSGDWVVPCLHGERLLTKPPGMYIAIVLASLPAGEVTTWSARLPSALAACGSVLLLGWYCGRQLGQKAAALTVLLTPLSLAWLDKTTAAEIDMLLVFFVVAGNVCFLRALEIVEVQSSPSPPYSGERGWGEGADLANPPHPNPLPLSTGGEGANARAALCGWLALAYLSTALGFLTKWTAPIFFVAMMLPFLYLRGQLRFLLRPIHLLSIVPALGLCATWVLLAADRVGGQVLWHEVTAEWLGHVGDSHHQQGYPWGETIVYPLRVFLAALPVSLFALLAAVQRARTSLSPCTQGERVGVRGFFGPKPAPSPQPLSPEYEGEGRVVRLRQAFLCWLIFSLAFWTIFPDHDVRQSLPLFPAFGGLAMLVWLRAVSARRVDARFGEPGVSAPGEQTVADGFSAGLHPRLAKLDVVDSPGADTPGSPRQNAVLIALIVGWLLVKLAFVHVVIPIRNHDRQPRLKGELLAQYVPAGVTLHLDRLKDDGLLFYYGRPTQRTNLQLPTSPSAPRYAILTLPEFRARGPGRCLPVLWLRDQQGDAIVLVRLH